LIFLPLSILSVWRSVSRRFIRAVRGWFLRSLGQMPRGMSSMIPPRTAPGSPRPAPLLLDPPTTWPGSLVEVIDAGREKCVPHSPSTWCRHRYQVCQRANRRGRIDSFGQPHPSTLRRCRWTSTRHRIMPATNC
jgi:hypothetical protein